MPRLLLAALVLTLAACQADDGSDPEIDAGAVERAVDPAPVDPGPAAASTPINLNTATEDEFKAIPGVGDRMAHEFDEYRPYASIEQFRREIGKYVDEEQVAEYERSVFVPVDPNESDAATLQQLPGVDAAVAEALVSGRPYADDDAFLAALADATGGDAQAARVYLDR
ncbi:helix-hairpin-helix domain-containing protein [Rubrivirga sp.]|uniref:helix-hairpin-helix domain-containing protein n=1 Tax=Rubrivirga sp. TaxID=1885344 RepID=UPI003B527115